MPTQTDSHRDICPHCKEQVIIELTLKLNLFTKHAIAEYRLREPNEKDGIDV